MSIAKKILVLTVAVILIIGLAACLDEIDLQPPPGTSDAIVIQGTLIKGNPTVASVRIDRLFDFSGNSANPVNVAFVELIDEDGVTLKLLEVGLGRYSIEIPEGSPDMDIDYYKSYKIRLITRDNREFISTLEPLIPVPNIDSLSLGIKKIPYFNSDGEQDTLERLGLYVSTSIGQPGETKYNLKWAIDGTFQITDIPIQMGVETKTCYITENVVGSNLPILDGNATTLTRVDDYEIHAGLVTTLMGEGAYYSVYQQSISNGAYTYWEQAKILVERQGGMFEPAAGKIVTNFSNPADSLDEVYGYFYAYEQDTARIYIDPEFVGNPNPACPPAGGLVNMNGDCVLRVCCNCLDHHNSTTTKPEWWIE